MKSTHNKLLALGKGMGLAFCLVTGTAAIMGVFSSVTPSAPLPDAIFMSSAQAAVPHAEQQPAGDSVLYQRVTQSDGSQRWVLLEESQALAFAPASRDLLMAELPASASISRVSYTLEAKPAGWNKVLKTCVQAEVGKPVGSAAEYDFACAKLG